MVVALRCPIPQNPGLFLGKMQAPGEMRSGLDGGLQVAADPATVLLLRASATSIKEKGILKVGECKK